MADLRKGALVQHATLGLGKIVALEPNAVHVFFPDADRRFAAKLRLPGAQAFLRTDGLEGDAWLEGLTAFSLDEKAGRYALAASWLSHEEAIAHFLAGRPRPFDDAAPAGEENRIACWRSAHARWAELLGNRAGERLLADGELGAVTKRLLQVEGLVSTLHPAADADAAREAFADEEAAAPFCAALLGLLSVPSPSRVRFERLFATARDLPVDPAQQWLLATVFPFIASPDRHLLVRPRTTCEAATRLGCDLGDPARPNWATYAALLKLSTRLREQLAPAGARDFVDVESFLHATATAKRRAKARPA